MNDKLSKCEIISTFVKRSKTNNNELCKQYFILASCNKQDIGLIIRKSVLTNKNFELYDRYGYELLKQYKDYRLYRQIFSIKLNTLKTVFKWIFSLYKK